MYSVILDLSNDEKHQESLKAAVSIPDVDHGDNNVRSQSAETFVIRQRGSENARAEPFLSINVS
ncbi:hypothetical protein FOXYSP1_07254 [Fusarium oxysporum f. sp. phaseoli]